MNEVTRTSPRNKMLDFGSSGLYVKMYKVLPKKRKQIPLSSCDQHDTRINVVQCEEDCKLAGLRDFGWAEKIKNKNREGSATKKGNLCPKCLFQQHFFIFVLLKKIRRRNTCKIQICHFKKKVTTCNSCSKIYLYFLTFILKKIDLIKSKIS